MVDMHGDGKTVCNLSRNEAWALWEQLTVLLEPREYPTSEPVQDA